MNKKLALLLTVSALLHTLVGLKLLSFDDSPPETPQTVTIIYQKSAPQPSAAAKRGRSKKSRGNIPLSALIPKMKIKFQSEEDWVKDTGENQVAQLTWTDSRTYDGFGASRSPGHSVEQSRFIRALWRMIDQYIEENPFLSEYNHTGNVFVRFEIDESGALVPRSLQASASDRVLKVIAVRAVRKAIRNETGDVPLPPNRMRIHARFSWSDYRTCADRRGLSGDYLSFCHYAENKRKTFSVSEKTGRWAGAIVQHGPWAYEEIQKYKREERRRKSQFNPFKKYERDPDWNL